MNSDYRISVGFFRHHKTRKLQKRLGSDGVLALLKLWGYAAEFRSDGDLSEMSAEDIELAIDWMKETPLIATLVEIGFIDGQEGSYCLHEWQEHNPWAAKDGSRSDKARFSRVAKTHPEIYKEMREKGINEISAIDYEKLTNTTKKQRTLNDSLENANGSLTNRSESATPAPIPAPIPAPKEEKAKSKAKERAHAPNAKTSLPADFTITPELQAWADKKGYGDLDQHLDSFRDKAQAKSYQYTDWNAAFRNAIREDWAGLRTPTTTAPTPRNGQRYPPLDKNARLLAGNQSAIEEWLGNRSHETHVIEGECHEVR